jgi:hypothetical protein
VPPSLAAKAAAPIICAGITTYKAIKEAGVRLISFIVTRRSRSTSRMSTHLACTPRVDSRGWAL